MLVYCKLTNHPVSELDIICTRTVAQHHRIIDDRIEKSKKGRQIGHCTFAASILKV